MVAAFVAGVVVAFAAVAFVGYKYHSLKAALAAVGAEVAKLEGEAGADEKNAVARIKKLLPAFLVGGGTGGGGNPGH